MTLRRLTVATMLVCGLCVWGFAHSGDATPVAAESRTEVSTHDEAEARYRAGQSNHWRHVAVGNCSLSR
jgi:hypothetical protein